VTQQLDNAGGMPTRAPVAKTDALDELARLEEGDGESPPLARSILRTLGVEPPPPGGATPPPPKPRAAPTASGLSAPEGPVEIGTASPTALSASSLPARENEAREPERAGETERRDGARGAGTGALICERARTHGDFAKTARVSQLIKRALAAGPSYATMPPESREALDCIATKLGRIACGDADFEDHWRDIVGYATLVATLRL
jgi:hypothetical protein